MAEPVMINENVAAAAAEDDDNGAQFAPIVHLQQVPLINGEEDEDVLLELKSKLYRFDKDGNQWKERGSGTVKFLVHNVTGRVRLVMRQSKTLKICANHLIIAGMTVQEHAGNDKSCVWHASDYADKELKDEMFCIRFQSVENCRTFMEMFQDIAGLQQPQAQNPQAAIAQPQQPQAQNPEAAIAEPQQPQAENPQADIAEPQQQEAENPEASETAESQQPQENPEASETAESQQPQAENPEASETAEALGKLSVDDSSSSKGEGKKAEDSGA
ncbi:hypothetical protein RND81_14G019300 [Saponaria officinalis]|uniref:RanBD1 domain-containing protein n=1 Tax=Saponaria officinalis TaxID=3572 RepID=A0AAW1GH59_SAPOF